MKVMLGEVCSVTMGQAPVGDSYNSEGVGAPLIAGAGDFSSSVINVKKFTTEPTKLCAADDIILSIRASIGARVSADREYCLGRGVAGLRPGASLDQRYLWHWIAHITPTLRAKGKGATFLQVNRTDIVELEMDLPSLDEQRRIAALLDRSSNIRQKRGQIVSRYDEVKRSIFEDMFGADVASSTVAAQASVVRTGPFGSQLLHSEFVDDGVAVLGLDNVVGNEFRWGERRFISLEKYETLKRYTVTPGDVLISIMGTTGRCVVVPNGIPTAINTKHICAITPDRSRLDSTFLRAAFLWHPDSLAHLRRQTKGSIMDGLNMGIIKAMPIPVPSIGRQKEFSAKVEQVDVCRRRAIDAASWADALFESLQAAVFSGRL